MMDLWRRFPAAAPAFVPPMLADSRPMAGSDKQPWSFERKFDGFRIIAVCTKTGAKLFSRSGHDVTARFAVLVDGLPQRDCVLDCEAVAFRGRQEDFQAVQNGRATHLAVFDVLNLDRHDVRNMPWRKRREVLDEVELRSPCIRSPSVQGDAETMLARACEAGWEGLIAKQTESTYTSGRSTAWRKLKCVRGQEFVIGGYTAPRGGRTLLGALHVGYHAGGRLKYAGKVGTASDEATLRDLHARLRPLQVDACPFADPPTGPSTWVEPRLVCQVDFTEWTPDGRLRHPRFKGLRTDKEPQKVIREPSAGVPG